MPGATSDEQLMQRTAGGDMDAFEELVRRHQQGAFGVAYRFLGDATRAEDVVQEAFLRILEAAARYRPTARFRTYLYSVIWRRCVDIFRRSKESRLDPAREVPAHSPGPDESALRDEMGARVRDAIGRLPPRQRMAVVLKHYEDMSYAEIGLAMGCSASAVDSLLIRARKGLRDMLRDVM